jgi:hypothetical protein
MNDRHIAGAALDQGQGIVRLAPNWVPRAFCIPGRRLKLHPDDYYALGANRGGIDERWFSSTVAADNGPLTPPDEGLSYIVMQDGAETRRVLLRDAVAELGAALIGPRLMDEYGRWPLYAKFFDNLGPLPFHLHQMTPHAARVGQRQKPEAYYFPLQQNNHGGRYPYTFFGFEPGTTRDQVKECLRNWNRGDNKITTLSRAYTLEPGTGWDVPAGVLHAPGSLCTYEPQADSDVFAMFQSLVDSVPIGRDLLLKDVPAASHDDLDYLVDMVDWDLNTDPAFAQNRAMRPRPVQPAAKTRAQGYLDHWVAYRSPAFSAKETTVLPGATVTLRDAAAYGLILLQGHGTLGAWSVESPTMIRFGQLTSDEFFVSEGAAQEGVRITNPSETDPLVMLRHYGPGNPDLGEVAQRAL